MIHVERQPEPRPPDFDFDREVRQRGLSALAELTGQAATLRRRGRKIQKRAEKLTELTPEMLRQYAYWTRALPALHKAYRGICAYACIYIEPITGPTVDHFVAITRSAPHEAYEWNNFRLACSLMNARKNAFPDVLDPFDVQDGWFALDLNTFEVQPAEGIGAELKQRVENTVDRLALNSRECVTMRKRWFDAYWLPKNPTQRVPLEFLENQAPFLARELQRQGRVHPTDQRANTPQ